MQNILIMLQPVVVYFQNPHNIIEAVMSLCLVCASFLISRQNQNAFWYWLVGNIIGIFFFYYEKNYGMTILSFYSTITSLYGLWNWKIKKKNLKDE
jgi:nicotinamide riboside transporter PnuC